VATYFNELNPLDRQHSASDLAQGEICWSLHKVDGATISCELVDEGQWGVQVKTNCDGELVFSRRFPDRSTAMLKVDDLKTEHIRSGSVVVALDEEPS
jgi:hypothetical protein